MREHREVLFAHVVDEGGEERAGGAGGRSLPGLHGVERRRELLVGKVAVLGAPLQPAVARQQAPPVPRQHLRVELDEEHREVARILAQLGQTPALFSGVPVAHREAELLEAGEDVGCRQLGAVGAEEPAAAQPPDDLAHRLGAVGPDRVEDQARPVAERRRREAGEVDTAAAVVAAVAAQSRRLPDGVDGHRYVDRQRADPARVVLGLGGRHRQTLKLRLRLLPDRHLQQVGAAAQLADIVEQIAAGDHRAVPGQCSALAVQRVDENGQLDQVQRRPVAKALRHQPAVVLHHQLRLRRDTPTRAVEVTVAALRAAERHGLADAALEQAVGAGDEDLDHVELAAQAAAGEETRAARSPIRRSVQIADRPQLPATVQVDLLPHQRMMRVQHGAEHVRPADVAGVGVVVARAAHAGVDQQVVDDEVAPHAGGDELGVRRPGDLDAAVVVVEQPEPHLRWHVLDGVDVVLGIGAQGVRAHRYVARLGDRRRDLGARQATTLARLGALVDLDLDIAHPAQVGPGEAEVPTGGLEALPLHVFRGGEPDRTALARRCHGDARVALDAGAQEILAGGAQRHGRVRNRRMPDGLAHGEAAQRESPARIALDHDRAVGGGAQHAGAVRAVPHGGQLRERLGAVRGDGLQPEAAVAVRGALQGMPGSERHLEAAAGVRLDARQSRALRSGVHAGDGTRRNGARAREAARNGKLDVVEQRGVRAQTRQRPGDRLARQPQPDAVERVRTLVAGDEEVVQLRHLPRRHAVDDLEEVGVERPIGVVQMEARAPLREYPGGVDQRQVRVPRAHQSGDMVLLAHLGRHGLGRHPRRVVRGVEAAELLARQLVGLAHPVLGDGDRHRVARGLLDVVDAHAAEELEDAVLPAGEGAERHLAQAVGVGVGKRPRRRPRVGPGQHVDDLGGHDDRGGVRHGAAVGAQQHGLVDGSGRGLRVAVAAGAHELHAGAQEPLLEKGVDGRREAVRLPRPGLVVEQRDAVVARCFLDVRPEVVAVEAQVRAEQHVRSGLEDSSGERLQGRGTGAQAARRLPRCAPRVELDDARRAHELCQRSALRQCAQVPRRHAHHEVGGVRQQPSCLRGGLVGLDDDQRARLDVVRRVGQGDGSQVGEFHLRAGAEGHRPYDQRHVQADLSQSVQALPAAPVEHDGGLLAHDVPGGAELLAQAVVGGMRDRRMAEVAAPVPMMPSRADGERLAAETLLEQLVDVEGGELELGDGARLTGKGTQEELSAAGALQDPEAGFVDAGLREQVRQQRGGAGALAHQP